MIKPLFLVVVVVFVCFECFLILSECRVLQPRSLLNVCAGRLHTFDVSKRVRDLDDSNHDDLVLSSFFNSLAFKWRQQQQRVHTSKRCTYFHISSPRAFLMEKCKSFTAFPLPMLPLHVNIHSFFSSAPHILLSLPILFIMYGSARAQGHSPTNSISNNLVYWFVTYISILPFNVQNA